LEHNIRFFRVIAFDENKTYHNKKIRSDYCSFNVPVLTNTTRKKTSPQSSKDTEAKLGGKIRHSRKKPHRKTNKTRKIFGKYK